MYFYWLGLVSPIAPFKYTWLKRAAVAQGCSNFPQRATIPSETGKIQSTFFPLCAILQEICLIKSSPKPVFWQTWKYWEVTNCNSHVLSFFLSSWVHEGLLDYRRYLELLATEICSLASVTLFCHVFLKSLMPLTWGNLRISSAVGWKVEHLNF